MNYCSYLNCHGLNCRFLANSNHIFTLAIYIWAQRKPLFCRQKRTYISPLPCNWFDPYLPLHAYHLKFISIYSSIHTFEWNYVISFYTMYEIWDMLIIIVTFAVHWIYQLLLGPTTEVMLLQWSLITTYKCFYLLKGDDSSCMVHTYVYSQSRISLYLLHSWKFLRD